MAAWTHRVTLNAVDITAKTALGLTVEEEESGSSLCDVTYYPATGTQDPDALRQQTLLVEVNIGAEGWVTLFFGRVLRAEWDQKSRSYQIRASDFLQLHFRNLGSAAAILTAMTGAAYSTALFGEEPDDLWEFAERCAETIPKDVHLTRTGNLAVVDWAAKGTADFALTAAEIHNGGAFTLALSDSDQMTNEVTVELDYRVQRWKVRKHHLSWSAWTNNVSIGSWCQWAIGVETDKTFDLPMLSLAEQAMMGGGWNVPSGVAFSTHPESGANLCAVQGWVWINSQTPGEGTTITSAAVDGYRALTQSIWESYALTFSADAAKALYSVTIPERKTGSRDVKADDTWPPESAIPQPAWSVDAIGDSYQDQADEVARLADLQCAYQWARAKLLAAHRATTLTVRTDLRPDITLSHTISIDCFGLVAKGKVRKIRYALDAAPYTELSISISRGGGGTDDAWAIPARPNTAPGYAAPAASQSYGTYVGAWVGRAAPPDPDERLGWVTNVTAGATGYSEADAYDSAFRIEWPEIEDAAQAELHPTASSTWEIAVPQDTLTII